MARLEAHASPDNPRPLTGDVPDDVPCVLPAIANAVGLPDGIALNAVLFRVSKLQEIWYRYQSDRIG